MYKASTKISNTEFSKIYAQQLGISRLTVLGLVTVAMISRDNVSHVVHRKYKLLVENILNGIKGETARRRKGDPTRA